VFRFSNIDRTWPILRKLQFSGVRFCPLDWLAALDAPEGVDAPGVPPARCANEAAAHNQKRYNGPVATVLGEPSDVPLGLHRNTRTMRNMPASIWERVTGNAQLPRASAVIATERRSAGLTFTVCLRGRCSPAPFSRCIHIPCRWSGCSSHRVVDERPRSRSP